ncbi:MAG TPA: hypothetical protein VGR38_08160, partial [Candidatus Polarisedimenticolia bacterium]|nr:hypothetical protein [Candidatus Polarisedimenticolia bacterium]
CYWPLYRIGRELGRSLFTLIAAFAWLNVNLVTASWTLCGMENSLHALVAWSLVASAIRMVRSGAAGSWRGWTVFSLLLVLNVWCRLDAALLSAILLGAVLWQKGERLRWRVLRTPVIIGAAGAVVQMAGFYGMGGYWLPVSALIKGGAHRWTLENFLYLLARGFDFVTPTSFILKPFQETVRVTWGPLALGILALALAASKIGGLRGRSLGRIWWALGLAGLIQNLVLSGMGEFSLYNVWYQSPYFVFCALTIAIATEGVARWALEKRVVGWKTLRGAAVLAVVLYGAFTATRFVRAARDSEYRQDSVFYTCYRFSRWLRDHTQKSDILASYNAGEIGYFSDRKVINLDGLANDYPYYRDVLRGKASLRRYLEANQVKYFVDYFIPAELSKDARIVHTLAHGDDRLYQALDVSSSARLK